MMTVGGELKSASEVETDMTLVDEATSASATDVGSATLCDAVSHAYNTPTHYQHFIVQAEKKQQYHTRQLKQARSQLLTHLQGVILKALRAEGQCLTIQYNKIICNAHMISWRVKSEVLPSYL